MLRLAIVFLSLSSPALAEVCDRAKYRLAEAEEGGPVQESRIDFKYESGVIVNPDGSRETLYCVQNNASAPVWIKWHGPKPDLLFEDYATGGGKQTTRHAKRYELTSPDDRRIEYGLSRSYGREANGRTLTFATVSETPRPVLAQTTPLDLEGRSLSDVLADAGALDEYLAAYRTSPAGGNELLIWSYATNWLPADGNVLARLAAGQEIEAYDGPYIPVSYGLRSAINIEGQTAVTSVRFWFGNFVTDGQALALARSSEILSRLSIVTAVGPFSGLSEFRTDARYPLSEVQGVLDQNVLEAKVGGGATAQIVPWTVGLTFDNVPISAMEAELFAN